MLMIFNIIFFIIFVLAYLFKLVINKKDETINPVKKYKILNRIGFVKKCSELIFIILLVINLFINTYKALALISGIFIFCLFASIFGLIKNSDDES